MSGLLVFMSVLLGVGAFGFGMLPLSFVFSRSHLARLSMFGTGLLLGAALGVIIPEGIEAVASSYPSSELPTPKIALSLLFGFTFMLIVEQLISPHSHSHSHSHSQSLPLQTAKEDGTSEVQFDAELGELEREQGVGRSGYLQTDTQTAISPEHPSGGVDRAYPLTLGLIMHGLADGLALGASFLPTAEPTGSSNLSFIVFLALVIHKAPTAVALTTSLLATSLPRSDCKKHLAFFSASTPLGAIASYAFFSFIGAGSEGDWTGIALLVSGGTFLYVATVLQPVSQHSGPSHGDEMKAVTRVVLISVGMFVPFVIGSLLGHGHGA